MTRLSGCMTGVLVVVSAVVCAAQTRAAKTSEVPGILPSAFGDAVDRDVVKVREATARF
jgi:hypothetical protein